ncbi:MAG: hypothetical protein KQH83_04880 [Actinobacteria bacterium]|nr:hypothetical protein [Actinomycetota bacterium]
MQPRLAIAHIHKTAGTTLSGALKAALGGRYCLVTARDPHAPFFDAAELHAMRRVYPRLEVLMGHDIRPWGDLHEAVPGLQYATFLRDPVTRCASHYQYDVQRGRVDLPFEEWIAHEVSPNRQVRHLAGPGASGDDAVALVEERVAFVGLLEHFDASLVMMAARFGLPPLHYVRKWSAPADDIKRRLLDDPSAREMLEAANREDMILYRHVVDEVLPRQEAAYGPALGADVEQFRAEMEGMTLARLQRTPRYAWYVAKWRLAYQPWVDRARAAAADRVPAGR